METRSKFVDISTESNFLLVRRAFIKQHTLFIPVVQFSITLTRQSAVSGKRLLFLENNNFWRRYIQSITAIPPFAFNHILTIQSDLETETTFAGSDEMCVHIDMVTRVTSPSLASRAHVPRPTTLRLPSSTGWCDFWVTLCLKSIFQRFGPYVWIRFFKG